MGFKSRSLLAGFVGGFVGEKNRQRQATSERILKLADNTAARDRERAISAYEATRKSAFAEQANTKVMQGKGYIEKTEDGKDRYTDAYMLNLAYEDFNKNKTSKQDSSYFEANKEAYMHAARQRTGEYHKRSYKDLPELDSNHQRILSEIDARQQSAGKYRAQTGFDDWLTMKGDDALNERKAQEAALIGGQPVDTFNPLVEDQGTQEYIEGDAGFTPQVEQVKRTGLQAVNIQNADGEDVDGTFWLDPSANEITGPGLQGFVDASTLQTLPQDRKPLTTQWTDESTGEEMKGDLIETFSRDPLAVLKRGGKTYVPVGTPVKLRGSQDQHGPKSLSSAQNKSLVRQDSAENVQALVDQMLAQDYKGNPAGWVAARLSTISSMFSHALPSLGGDEGDLEAIVDYIKGNLSEDAKASAAIGLLDARAVAEGNVEAINTLLSYGTALWMNGGTRITNKVSEDAESITQSFLTGSAVHKGKLASLQNQTSRAFSTEAARNLNYAKTDNNSTMWGQYPTAKKYHDQGWDFATDKADGFTLKRSLDELKKSDPELYQRSLDSLESTMSSYDTITTPIFWSKKYGTNVMLYHRTDPKTGAIKFRTMKVR